MVAKPIITFKPKPVVKKLLSVLVPRGRDVMISRYGLSDEGKKLTLESIGKKYGITRERVRQIENYSLDHVRKSKEYKEATSIFKELQTVMDDMGGIIEEGDFLRAMGNDNSTRNHIHFLLVIGEQFTKHKEDDDFRNRWHIDPALASKIHDSLKKVYGGLSDNDLIAEKDFIASFLDELKEVAEKYKKDEIIKRWLSLSKKIGSNPLV